MYNILSVNFKNTVATNELFIISVDVSTWDYLKKQVTWGLVKNRYAKWGALIDSQ